VIAILVSLGCAEQEEEVAFTADTVNAADLHIMFAQDEPYTDYAFWPDARGLMPGKAPHGKFMKTFVNDRALNASGDTYPYGSLIVKENYKPDTTLAKVTIMYKVKGYDPDDGDWFWAVYGADGTVEAEGGIQSCISCHRVREDQDYVFLHDLK
jgi:hypothetical protein